jgi:uncharacterized membrane protein
MWPFNQIARLEDAAPLDAVGAKIKPFVEKALANRRVTDALHGVWLGHPLHPVLVQVPVGAWTSAAILDAIPAARPAATLLIGVGMVGAVPAAAAGVADWSQQDAQQQRTGLAHAMGNVAALGLYGGALIARSRSRHGLGRALAYSAYALAGASATVGGHLAYRQAAGMVRPGSAERTPGRSAGATQHRRGEAVRAPTSSTGARSDRSVQSRFRSPARGSAEHGERPRVHHLPMARKHVPGR